MQRLLILGASARSAAESALRAGFRPLAADLFADLDLTTVAPVTRVERYPQGLFTAAQSAPLGPWMYTGALENEPELIDRLAEMRPLWGNRGAELSRARDPLVVERLLREAGLHTPKVRLQPPPSDDPRRWLVKPRRSAGGRKIFVWDTAPTPRETPSSEDVYFHLWVDGTACSSVFVVGPQSAALVGSSEQWIGASWCGARGFQFAGALGPLSLPPAVAEQLTRLGERLWRDFHLRGLVGVDWLLRDEEVWVVELNPRYTASVEILERSLGLQLIQWHARSCAEQADVHELPGAARGVCGKAILYATRDSAFPKPLEQVALQAHTRWNEDAAATAEDDVTWGLADIPAGGSPLQKGRPVLTVLAQGPTRQQVQDALRSRVAWVQRCIEQQDLTEPL